MNRKFLAILVVVIAICSTTTVFAVNLSDTHDFDGLFKMKVSNGDNFTKVDSPILKANNFYKNANDTIFVLVYDSDISAAVKEISKGNLSIVNSGVYNNTGVINEGKLYIFNSTADMSKDIGSYKINSFVGINKDKGTPRSVIVCGSDAKLVKEYANTITFD